jgi:D-sedoheptulose 7-phosphate isomerase
MIKEIIKESIYTKRRVLENDELLENIDKTINIITETIRKGNKVLIMGNGGSAADAQHFAGEFVNRFLMERTPLPAISLSTDTSVITCIGNDYSFDDIFKKQVEAIARKDDVLIGITTSGNSENILRAFEAGRAIGTINIGLLGKDGGKARDFTDINIIVNSDITPRIQEMHITIIHIICEIVEKNIFQKKVDVIAIDGPSGAGKSTIAKLVAEKLGYEYISTGAMYRLIALLSFENSIFDEHKKVKKLCEKIEGKISFKNGKIFLDGVDYTDKIYENRVSMLASEISKRDYVRKCLGKLQRETGLKQKSVLEGRDIGTVIFPDARYKFFLDASAEVRAKRRYVELKSKNENVEYEKILNEIIERDKNDSTRNIAPLKKSVDAIYIDTSNLTIEQVVDKILTFLGEDNGN